MLRSRARRIPVCASAIFALLWGCSSDSGNSGNVGGSANGGATHPSTGGNPGTATGGSSNAGGAVTVGGSTASGGASNGGALAEGGKVSGGGAPASGGKTGSGGFVATGGLVSGGAATSGGQTSTGGRSSKGGSTATGGTNPAGGSVATGGTSSGGNSSSGGAAVGGSATGGAAATTCPTTTLKSGDTTRTIQVGSSSRSYVLHVPTAYDGSKPVPLVVDFHPLGGSGPSERTSSPYPARTDPEGVIMAFPSGLTGPSGGAWNVGPCCVANVDDVAFAKALVADIQKSACIDAKRIYAVGFSMGGGMSHYLACQAADVFAAVAPAAFDLLQQNVGSCKPPRPITVISFRGTSDPIVPYGGGASSVVAGMPVTFLGAKATFQKWAELNQCSGSASAEDAQGCSSYSGCQGGVEVMLCTKQGGGHEAGNAAVGWPALKRHVMP